MERLLNASCPVRLVAADLRNWVQLDRKEPALTYLGSSSQVRLWINSRGHSRCRTRTRLPVSEWSSASSCNKRTQLICSFQNCAASEDSANPPSTTVTVNFRLERECLFGQYFSVVGDDPLLGAWDPQSAIPMEWSEGHVWNCQTNLPAEKHYEFKFILRSAQGLPEWQPGDNRRFDITGTSSSMLVLGTWEVTAGSQENEADTSPSEEGSVPDGLSTSLASAADTLEDDSSASDIENTDSSSEGSNNDFSSPDISNIPAKSLEAEVAQESVTTENVTGNTEEDGLADEVFMASGAKTVEVSEIESESTAPGDVSNVPLENAAEDTETNTFLKQEVTTDSVKSMEGNSNKEVQETEGIPEVPSDDEDSRSPKDGVIRTKTTSGSNEEDSKGFLFFKF